MQESQQRALMALERRGRLRALAPRQGLDFSSNDYLALASSEALRQAAHDAIARGVAVGSSGSRLLRGNDPEHEQLELEAAEFFGAESCLFFASGFAANQSLLSTLPARGDLVVVDELAHASMWDGLNASKATAQSVRHNDPDAFEDAIRSWRNSGGKGRIWLVVESLFSMDGDRAPLAALHDIANRHDAMLVVDEAHATGVLGAKGRGLAADIEGADNVITVHTCGKALGAMGALVMLPRLYRDFMINRSRAYIYSTAPSPLIAAVVRASLELCATRDQPRQALQALVTSAQKQMQEEIGLTPTTTQIQPVIVGPAARTVALSNHMIAHGFDVRAVRPPTVPEGTSRLRISLTLNVTADDVQRMIAALASALRDNAS